MPWLQHVPGTRAKVVDGITPPLRRCALVVTSSGRRQLAGRLCPNAVAGNASRLDDLADGSFVLVTSTPLTIRQREKFDTCGVTVVFAGFDEDLGRWLRSGRARAALVRPDRTVMQAGRHIDPMCDTAATLIRPVSVAQ